MSRPYISAKLRQAVIALDKQRCAYCLSAEVLSGIALTVDHIFPVVMGGETALDNLCAACRSCNEFKGMQTEAVDPDSDQLVLLFNPRNQRWADHFRWDESGTRIEGLTRQGRSTISALKLNHPLILKARSRWVMAGWHPPDDC